MRQEFEKRFQLVEAEIHQVVELKQENRVLRNDLDETKALLLKTRDELAFAQQKIKFIQQTPQYEMVHSFSVIYV